MEEKCDKLEHNFQLFLQKFKAKTPAHSVFKAYKEPLLSTIRPQSLGPTRRMERTPPPRRASEEKDSSDFGDLLRLQVARHYKTVYSELTGSLQRLVLSPA